MNDDDLFDQIEQASASVRKAVGTFPKIAVTLGSGLGHLVDELRDARVLDYSEIPFFPVPTIAGHAGKLCTGLLGGVPVAMLQGRVHYYEGNGLDRVTFPTRVLQRLGVKSIILTAATGGVALNLHKGDLVCLTDHINGLGFNPLRGPNDDRFGTRFPDMSEVYSVHLRSVAHEEAMKLGITLKSGVYYAMPGPSYETPAEIRMLRTLGADVVGMSTVPEAIVARHGGINVLGFAMVTNAAAGVTGETIHHAEVLDVAEEAGKRLGKIIAAVVPKI